MVEETPQRKRSSVLRRVGWAVLLIVLVCVLAAGGTLLLSFSRVFQALASTGAMSMCAGVFITGRSQEEVAQQTFSYEPPREKFYSRIEFVIDRENRRVTARAPLIADIHAVLMDDRGCVLLPPGVRDMPPPSKDAAAKAERYQEMTVVTREEVPTGVDGERMDRAIATLFERPEHRTHSFLVYHRGRLIREVYAQGGGPAVPSESWSFGKTLVGALVGSLIESGDLSLDERVTLDLWPEGDPRRDIRVRDMLGMAGGLAMSNVTRFYPIFLLSEHARVYDNVGDVTKYCAERPLAHTPGEAGDYNNADPILLLAYIRQKLSLDAKGLRDLLRARVLKPLGMDTIIMSTDYQGMPVITGYVYGSARDWAKLGLLYAQNGSFNGVRIFSEDYARFSGEPAKGYPGGAYGAMLWLNRARYYSAPDHVMIISGSGDQIVMVDRVNELVLVRMGHTGKTRDTFLTMNPALREIYAAFGVDVTAGKGAN